MVFYAKEGFVRREQNSDGRHHKRLVEKDFWNCQVNTVIYRIASFFLRLRTYQRCDKELYTNFAHIDDFNIHKVNQVN